MNHVLRFPLNMDIPVERAVYDVLVAQGGDVERKNFLLSAILANSRPAPVPSASAQGPELSALMAEVASLRRLVNDRPPPGGGGEAQAAIPVQANPGPGVAPVSLAKLKSLRDSFEVL